MSDATQAALLAPDEASRTSLLASPVKITRRPTKDGQRVWFSCRVCGGYGDASGPVEATEYVLSGFEAIHVKRCATQGESDG